MHKTDTDIAGMMVESSSASVFTSAEYRAWLSRAPSTSAIYERLKNNRDMDLIQTQKAAKLTYSAENLTLLDRARTRTERQLKMLTESLERENLSNLAQWEAQQRQQEQQRPYYSYRTHLTSTGLTGGDSTLARVLAAGRSPSTSSALSALGSRTDPSLRPDPSPLKESLSSDPLRRLVGITPSRSRDLLSSLGPSGGTSLVHSSSMSHTSSMVVSSKLASSPSGDPDRRSPSASLLHRISAEKDESLLRKEILSRSLIGRDLLSRESLKDELEDKSEKIAARLSAVQAGMGIHHTGHPGAATAALLAGRHLPGGGGTGPPVPPSLTSSTPPGGSITSTGTGDSRLKLLTINPSEFSRYKIERPSSNSSEMPGSNNSGPIGHSGLIRVHLMAGRALRSTVKTTDASIRTRDLYCVLECDRVHKARTVVCTGDQNFDWDEIFDLDLVQNKELDFLIYSWDPQLRHRLCYKGSVNLVQVLNEPRNAEYHQLAIKVEPRGTLYVKLKHTPPEEAFKREVISLGLFGANLASIVMKEDSGLNVPLIVQRCIEEIERRGLDIIGLYRLCGSATKKQTLRDTFERSPRSVDLSAENVPDINVITGVLKDYLRELPEPLLTKCLYQMLVDALGVCLPDDPEGNARLLYSIIECLPKPNRCTLLLILEHLSLVCSLSDRNKMGPAQLAQCFGPILMIQYDLSPESIDFQPPIKVLQYLLETWPAKSVTLLQTVRAAGAEAVRKGPSLLGKGRSPFPRSSSPASILLAKSQKSSSAQPLPLLQSPTKVGSPGSHSESSPSPTSIHSKLPQQHQYSSTANPFNVSSGGPGAVGNNFYSQHQQPPPHPSLNHPHHHHGIQPQISGAPLTLTPSTTSSSLTSVTTPNSLTPVGSSAKSIIPLTTLSNYSIQSEFSTTSVTSPTPTPSTIREATSSHSIQSNVSQSSQQSATATAAPQPPGSAYGNGEFLPGQQPNSSSSSGDDVFATVSVRNRASVFERTDSSGNVIPSSTNGAEQGKAIGDADMDYYEDPLGQFQQQGPLNNMNMPISSSGSIMPQNIQSMQQHQTVPPSPFMGRKMMGGLPGRAERADSFEDGSTTTSSNSSNNSISSKRRLPSVPQTFGRQDSGEFANSLPQQQQQGQGQEDFEDQPDLLAGSMKPFQAQQQYSEQNSKYYQQPPQQQTDLQQFHQDSGFSSKSSSSSSSVQQPSSGQYFYQTQIGQQEQLEQVDGGGVITKPPKPVPPPPPPKPGSGNRPRLSSSDDESYSSLQDSPVLRPKQSNGHSSMASDTTNGGGSGSSGGSATTTPTTQIPNNNSKSSSPGPATPMGTPPPVPPRLDRRPSQPSPTSSPPAMPPPVPPRLGRAAPTRTPSLDGREAFEVDCYTIKEENGEEDFLT